jgi:hypothetical protein
MKKSLMSKIVEAYRENAAAVFCGFAMMNGQANVYTMYRSLKADSAK